MSRQLVLSVEASVTVTVPDDFDRGADDIPMKLDAFDMTEISDSQVEEVNETEIITKEIIADIQL